MQQIIFFAKGYLLQQSPKVLMTQTVRFSNFATDKHEHISKLTTKLV